MEATTKGALESGGRRGGPGRVGRGGPEPHPCSKRQTCLWQCVCVCVGGGLITTPQASPNEAQKRPREAPAPPLCPAQAADPLPPAPCFPLSR